MTDRVVFDLNETLITQDSLRPGALELLGTLTNAGIELILWTQLSNRQLDETFRQHPELKSYFIDIYTQNRKPDAGLIDDLFPRKTRKQAKDILKGQNGGKVPQLVGSNILVDDNPNVGVAAFLLDFVHLDPKSTAWENSDSWAKRIAASVLSLIRPTTR